MSANISSIASVRKARQDLGDAYKAIEITLRSNNETVAKAWETYQTNLAQVPTFWDIGRPGAFSAVAIFSGWKLGSLMAKLAGNYGATPQQQIWIAKIGAIFTGAITWSLTRSAGLTFVNTAFCFLLAHDIPNNGAIGLSAIVGAAVSSGYLVYTVLSGNTAKGHYFQYSQVVGPLVRADETVKRAMETYRAELNRISLWSFVANIGTT